jgi:long-chain fatty acid transport protein
VSDREATLSTGENMGKINYGLLACVSAAALISGLDVANAGGFAVREQSAQFQGSSFAGDAAGGGLSSMFWNPAATASVNGTNTESVASIVFGQQTEHADSTSGLLLNPRFHATATGDYDHESFVPASYANYQVNDRLYLGLAMNSPFGLTTKSSNTDWAGTPITGTVKVFSMDINPTVAYKLTPEITVGVGAQIEFFSVRLTSTPVTVLVPGVGAVPLDGRQTKGDDWTFGGTAGVLWQPAQGTSIGLGYRSPVEISTDVSCHGGGLSTFQLGIPSCTAAGPNGHVDFVLPETVTLSARQDVTERLALLGTIEWTHHERIQNVHVYNSAGVAIDQIPLNFEDGWFYALGAEYKYSPTLTLRTGVAYEKSPTTDATRYVYAADSDRIWVSGGATYKWSDKITLDLAYSHLFFDDAKLAPVPTGGALLTGYAETSADIISTSLKYKLGGGIVPLEPYK